MSRMIFDITDEQRNRLEGYRSAFGHRSLTAALQALIQAAPQPVRMHAPAQQIPMPADPIRQAVSSSPVQLGPTRQAPGARLKTKP